MKLCLALALILLAALSHAQTGLQQASQLVVVKFSCGRYETGSGMIRSVQEPDPPMNEPISINQSKNNEPQEVKNRRDMAERRADLRTAEINASLSSKRGSKIYFYRLQVRNAGDKVIKGFAWSYQPAATADLFDRQFFCAIKARQNESKDIELFSPLAPSRVIDASKEGEKSAKKSDAGVVINKIEYLDGSVWQRPGWNPKTFSVEDVQKVAPGKCIGL